MIYSFQLGHQPEISAAEIKAVLCSLKHLSTKALKHSGTTYLILETKEKIDAQKLINTLGGTIKIAIRHSERSEESLSLINKFLNYLITNQPTGKIEFSIADTKIGLQIKKELKKLGRSARYIEPKNTATILHNHLIEKKADLTVIDNNIFVTEAIQPFEEFAERDYGRPKFDDKSGMLPPKLAKIMINLAQVNKDATILDPFCGSGTILTEALTMGYTNLIGNDISKKAIQDTEENIKWMKEKILNIKYFNIDAREIHQKIKINSIDAVITEPHLGKPLAGNESKQYLQKQAQELSQLYVDSFKSFYKILKPAGIVVFIIPRFTHNNEWVRVNCVEEITTATAGSRPHGGKKVGFEILPFDKQPNLLYHRPTQRLAREIWRFKKIL